MKKIGSIKMHDANMMSDDEMKRILGGDLSTTTRTSCSIRCPGGVDVTITNCDGDCIAKQSEYYVKCDGVNNLEQKYCDGKKPTNPI